jgi:signal transduction histidine kinase
MSVTAFRPSPSPVPRLTLAKLGVSWPEVAWAVFALANLGAMFLVELGETIPFHFVWVSFTLVYGIRLWRLRTTAILLAVVMIGTGVTLAWALVDTGAGWDEMAEVPLMAAMFAAVIWHVERRQAALDEVRRLAEIEHRLLESERNLVRDVSHELRTPITVARGHAELIRASASGQSEQDAEVILDELNRLSRISERLLLLAAAEHPEFLRLSSIDMERLIVDTAKRWSVAASRHWHVNVLAEGTLEGDEERLQTILDALIENAVKFTREDDAISIVGRNEGDIAVIEIVDTGEGIPSTQLNRVFDRFSRAEVGRRGPGGTGLGLAIVKAIVEAHGGSVAVESEPGTGSMFTLSLPSFRPASPVGNGYPDSRERSESPKLSRAARIGERGETA